MKKAAIILIVLALVGGGAYYFLTREKEPAIVCDAGFRLDFGTRTCVPIVTDNDPSNVDFGKIEVSVPDTAVKVLLVREGETTKYAANFADPEDPNIKGFVSVDASKITRVSDSLMLAPLYVNYGGTGQFLNVALFDAKTNRHVGTLFVGDRTAADSIIAHEGAARVPDQYVFKINYKTRTLSQGFASEADVPAQLVVEIRNGSISEIMRLQNADYGDVEIKSPLPGSTISGDFALKGSVPGSWYFEASAQFKILDSTYKEVAIGSVQALSDWMTTQRVPFEVKMNTSMLNAKGKATIVISSENVEGGEEGERKVKRMEIPVVIK